MAHTATTEPTRQRRMQHAVDHPPRPAKRQVFWLGEREKLLQLVDHRPAHVGVHLMSTIIVGHDEGRAAVSGRGERRQGRRLRRHPREHEHGREEQQRNRGSHSPEYFEYKIHWLRIRRTRVHSKFQDFFAWEIAMVLLLRRPGLQWTPGQNVTA